MLARQEQAFTFDGPAGARLRGVLHLPAAAAGDARAAAVLLCHGMLSSKDGVKQVALARALAARGLFALRFDFQGRGESSGDLRGLTLTRELGDARAALAELARRTGARRLGLAGSSLGAAVGVLLAAEAPLGGLVTVAGVGRAELLAERVVGREGLARWARDGVLEIEGAAVGHGLVEDGACTDLAGAAARVRCPWLILHGAADEVVPVSDARLLHQASGGRATLEVLPGGDHRLLARPLLARVLAQSVRFLEAALAGEVSP